MNISEILSKRLESIIISEALALNHIVDILTSPKSKWPDATNRNADPVEWARMIKKWVETSLVKYDPTGKKGMFMPFIAKQLAAGPTCIRLRMPTKQGIERAEDGDRLLSALTFFMKESIRKSWGALLHKYFAPAKEMPIEQAALKYRNIQSFRDWRHIEQIKTKVENDRSDKTENTGESEHYKLVFEFDSANSDLPTPFRIAYRAYEVLEPEAFYELGIHTNWCTSRASNPSQYNFTYPDYHRKAGMSRSIKPAAELKPWRDNTPAQPYPASYGVNYFKDRHWIVHRSVDGGPFEPLWQFGGKSFMYACDQPPARISLTEDYFLGKWATEGKDAPIDIINSKRKTWRPPDNWPPNKKAAVIAKYSQIRPPLS